MTGREADPELRRSANSLLLKNGNNLDKALVAYCKYLLDDATTLRPRESGGAATGDFYPYGRENQRFQGLGHW